MMSFRMALASARPVGCVLLAVAVCLRYRVGMPALHDGLFNGAATDAVRRELLQAAGGPIGALRASLVEAFAGSPEGGRRYVADYRRLTSVLLEEAHRACPDAVVADRDGRLAITDAAGGPIRALNGLLDHAAVDAPFTPWTNAYEPAEAVALYALNHVRLLVGAPLLAPPAERLNGKIDDLAAQRFQRVVLRELERPAPLHRLMGVFRLSKSELGRLFGVTRQAIDGWLAQGVPAEREDKLATLLALADLLERKLKTDRIPGIARRPAEAYGGHTMLELIAADRQRELLELVRRSFDWSQAA